MKLRNSGTANARMLPSPGRATVNSLGRSPRNSKYGADRSLQAAIAAWNSDARSLRIPSRG